MLRIYTAQYNYSGTDKIDITAKSATYPWNVFAPDWNMVMNYKKTGDKQVYIEKYEDICEKAFEAFKKELTDLIFSNRIITLVCFCKPDNFCHRVLLAQWFAKKGALYIGERNK